MARTLNTGKQVQTLTHRDDRRPNIPTAEYESVMDDEQKRPIQVAYERRNRDLDPQLVWRGKDEQDWSDLVVPAPPLYIQEKVHPKVLVDDLRRHTEDRSEAEQQMSLFGDFGGLPNAGAATEFYQHESNWTNRLILGDSLQVMASLAEREGLRGKVQCIYIDPPYGIKFNSNFQWSTTSRDVKDGNREHISREPEQVKAFRDTWRDGIHSYLTYLRDRLTVARDLLADSGSIFVQIGDENVHRVRALMDEVFRPENHVSDIIFQKTTGASSISGTTKTLAGVYDTVLWYARSQDQVKFRQPYNNKAFGGEGASQYVWLQEGLLRRRIRTGEDVSRALEAGGRIHSLQDLTSASGVDKTRYPIFFRDREYRPGGRVWRTSEVGMPRLLKADRIEQTAKNLWFVSYIDDFAARPVNNIWDDCVHSFLSDRTYVVQTSPKVIERCILMTTDPGDLVLDPTCGSGTTAYVAEQWGRRWVTIDTSRVALALARARIMGARYPYYLLADSKAGQRKEAEVTRTVPSTAPTHGNIRHGFVYERVPHITLKSIANNAEIDVIWEQYQQTQEPLREQLNAALGKRWQEWEIPREADKAWPERAKQLHEKWWEQRIARQREIDKSIAAKADSEFLYDKPYEDKNTVRVAGPFTVESLSPHRVLVVDEDDELQGNGKFVGETKQGYGDEQTFVATILENLRMAGVQQAHKEDRITFTALTGWPGRYISAEGRYLEGENGRERRAGVFIGPEFGTVPRSDLVAAAREAGDAGFDVLIACAFNYDAHSAEFEKLGRIPVLKARMNADLHMADTLKNTGTGNLFVIFGEPDIDIEPAADGQLQVKIHGVDVFHPQSGEVRSSGPEGIACWFIDTDYNEESFFVRHAYFLGANDPYKALKTTLKVEIDEEAWESLHSDVSRPFPKPKTGRIAVKVINHLGDEVMKVFSVD
ncbi:MAG: site-specific DNA-methyltransferase [Chloroflexota bacterium]|nr:site-specific DNA-methyltransferase [Chloroflexota bacterium]